MFFLSGPWGFPVVAGLRRFIRIDGHAAYFSGKRAGCIGAMRNKQSGRRASGRAFPRRAWERDRSQGGRWVERSAFTAHPTIQCPSHPELFFGGRQNLVGRGFAAFEGGEVSDGGVRDLLEGGCGEEGLVGRDEDVGESGEAHEDVVLNDLAGKILEE